MQNNPFVNQPEIDLQTIASELAAHSVPLPEEPAAILERWHKLVQAEADDNAGPETSRRRKAEVTAAYAAGEHDRADQLATAAASASMRQEARRRARVTVTQQFLVAVRHSDVVTTLVPHAEPLIDHLHQAAKLDHLDVTSHVRNGDRAAADLAAYADPKADALNRLYRLKAVIIGRPLPFDDGSHRHATTETRDRAILKSACTLWRNPHQAPNPRGTSNLPSSAESWCNAIRAGLDPWFPTLAESDALVSKLLTEMPPEDVGFFGRGVTTEQAHTAILEASTRHRAKLDGGW